MIKKIFYIFIPLLAVLFMSHNANAANISYNLNDYDLIRSVNLGTQYCAYTYNTFNTTSSICLLTTSRTASYGIQSYDISHEKGDLSEFYLAVSSNYQSTNIYGNLGLYMDNFGSVNDHFKIISVQNVVSDNGELNEITGHWSCTWVNNGETCQYAEDNSQEIYFARIYKFTILWTDKGSHPVGLYALNQNTPIFVCKFSSNAGSGAQCRIRMFGYTQWEYKGSSVNKEQSEQTQDAADNSATSGSSSASNSQTSTSSLLSVITSGIGAITSASPTNCKINGNMGNLNVGNIDLCANPVPTFMALIGSIIAVLVVLPLVILLFNRFISIIRSFQR